MSGSSAQIISQHRSPHPRLRWITARLLALGLIVMGSAVVLQIVLAIVLAVSGLPGWLFLGTAFFTAVLTIPLLMGTVIHPEVSITREGILVQPMIWRSQLVDWDAIQGTAPHPLIFNDEGTGQLLYGKRYHPREGLIILVRKKGGLSPLYRLLAGIAGSGHLSAFGISSTTHTDYETLVSQIEAHTSRQTDQAD